VKKKVEAERDLNATSQMQDSCYAVLILNKRLSGSNRLLRFHRFHSDCHLSAKRSL
jgi:hypothetical protein